MFARGGSGPWKPLVLRSTACSCFSSTSCGRHDTRSCSTVTTPQAASVYAAGPGRARAWALTSGCYRHPQHTDYRNLASSSLACCQLTLRIQGRQVSIHELRLLSCPRPARGLHAVRASEQGARTEGGR